MHHFLLYLKIKARVKAGFFEQGLSASFLPDTEK
jgi:hypothetical protein